MVKIIQYSNRRKDCVNSAINICTSKLIVRTEKKPITLSLNKRSVTNGIAKIIIPKKVIIRKFLF